MDIHGTQGSISQQSVGYQADTSPAGWIPVFRNPFSQSSSISGEMILSSFLYVLLAFVAVLIAWTTLQDLRERKHS